MAAGFLVFSIAGTDSSYWLLLAGLVLLGVGAALATTPATTAIVSSLPPAKQGVASAVNDAAREVGGALGIAVLGSALADGYGSGVAGAVAGAPPELAHRAEQALPAALALAERLGAQGPALAERAQAAFVDGLGAAMLIAAGVVAAAALFVFWRAPRDPVGVAEPDATPELRPVHHDPVRPLARAGDHDRALRRINEARNRQQHRHGN
jgi:hypothetical protein